MTQITIGDAIVSGMGMVIAPKAKGYNVEQNNDGKPTESLHTKHLNYRAYVVSNQFCAAKVGCEMEIRKDTHRFRTVRR
jgi:hypothetical protein